MSNVTCQMSNNVYPTYNYYFRALRAVARIYPVFKIRNNVARGLDVVYFLVFGNNRNAMAEIN